jgi:hypothetical protein
MNDKINEALKNSGAVSIDESGEFYVKIYADYRDEMSDETIAKILNAEYPEDALNEELAECYADADMYVFGEAKDKTMKYLHKTYPDEEFDEDEVLNYIYENVYAKYPIDHYLKQEVYANIFMDTGDGNYDYVLNCIYPHYSGRKGEALDSKASIAWLAKQQGYSKTALKKALYYCEYNNSAFLKSMRVEVHNMSTHMGTVAFLIRTTLEKLMEINRLIKLQDINGIKYDATENPYCGYIILDKNVMTGIYDPWSGGGSVLEVELEKDVKIPIKYIRSALPDGEDGYSIESAYGMSGSAWKRDMIKTIHAPVKHR